MADRPKDTYQYLTDASAKRTHIVLSLEEYEALLEDRWHREVLAERRGGETLSLDERERRSLG
ncbi:MAG: hypothetical protein KGZ60_01080 [Truepera sp.]|nr:hypothetical protein [Truepera sp.]